MRGKIWVALLRNRHFGGKSLILRGFNTPPFLVGEETPGSKRYDSDKRSIKNSVFFAGCPLPTSQL